MHLGKKISGLALLSVGVGMLVVIFIPKGVVVVAVGMVIVGFYFLFIAC